MTLSLCQYVFVRMNLVLLMAVSNLLHVPSDVSGHNNVCHQYLMCAGQTKRLGDGILDMRPDCAEASSGAPQCPVHELIDMVELAGGMGLGHDLARCKAACTGKWL